MSECFHTVTRVVKKITYIPQDEQASASWEWAAVCASCGETVQQRMYLD